jgi:hypothetical protein
MADDGLLRCSEPFLAILKKNHETRLNEADRRSNKVVGDLSHPGGRRLYSPYS